MKPTYYRDPGFLYDLFFAYHCHFNTEKVINANARICGADEAAEYIDSINKLFAPIPDELHLFFAQRGDGRLFMSDMYFAGGALNDPINVNTSNVLKSLRDTNEVIKGMIRFWFPGSTGENTDIASLSPVIDAADIDERVKRELYSFIVDPKSKLDLLIASLTKKEKILAKYYAANHAETENIILRAEDVQTFAEEIFNIVKMRVRFKAAKADIGFSVCLLNRYLIYISGNETKPDSYMFVLGANYRESVTVGGNGIKPKLDELGAVLEEPNRIAIIDFIRERGEITRKDLERTLNFTGTTAHYHLNMMLRIKLLKVRCVRRQLYYSLNPDYFNAVIEVLKGYLPDMPQ